ncbi:hypothetical protein L9F63_025175, partial [Diploptera punctata]
FIASDSNVKHIVTYPSRFNCLKCVSTGFRLIHTNEMETKLQRCWSFWVIFLSTIENVSSFFLLIHCWLECVRYLYLMQEDAACVGAVKHDTSS